ncbi:hypothetical protein Droror1_Dr00005755 [Drosera rotundifolia]
MIYCLTVRNQGRQRERVARCWGKNDETTTVLGFGVSNKLLLLPCWDLKTMHLRTWCYAWLKDDSCFGHGAVCCGDSALLVKYSLETVHLWSNSRFGDSVLVVKWGVEAHRR